MNKTHYLRGILMASSAIALVTPAQADDAADRVITLDTITVTTTKTEDAVVDQLAGASVVTRTDLDRIQPDRISDALVSVPGLEVSEDGDDPASSINIRGLQDFGRVNVMIEGARQNFQRSDHGANGTFYLEPELIKRVDIVRGPVATIYGSGAIGGVVNFLLKDPEDIVEPGETWALQTKAGYTSNEDGILISTTGAVQPSEAGGVLGNIVYRDDGEYKDGSGDVVRNSDENILSALIKGKFRPADGHIIEASYTYQDADYTTRSVGTTGTITARDTKTEDDTATVKWHYDAPDNPLVDWSVSTYYTSTKSDQTLLSGTGTAGSERQFRIRTAGTDFHNTSEFFTGSIAHAVTIGGDIFRDKIKVEDGDPAGSADEFTPTGKRIAYGAFIQDEIEVTDWLEFIGALRFDGYELSGGGNKSTGTRISPKVTVGITPFQGIQFYASYAEGYRAPAVTEAFNSGTHPVPPAFVITPNPNLKPETAQNYELGVNLKFDDIVTDGDAFRAKATIFRNEVKNYIDAFLTGFIPATCFGFPFNTCGTFQYQNISKARLEGVEVEATYDAGTHFAQMAYTRIRGDDLAADVPLISVHPDKLVTTVGLRFLEERLTIGGRWTMVDAQNRLPGVDRTGGVVVARGSHDPVDLFATYDHNRYFSTAITLKNIFDESYTKYLNLDPSPGFTAGISATIKLGG